MQGNADLRLNAERLGSDVGEFERAIATARLDDAVDLYAGPFLDGFHLTDSPEFERWLDVQRESFARAWRTAAESGRRTLHERGRSRPRRRRLPPTRGGRAVRAALRARTSCAPSPPSGDPAAALAHARVHAQLLDQEFGEPMPAGVRALVEELELRSRPARDRVHAGDRRGRVARRRRCARREPRRNLPCATHPPSNGYAGVAP